MASQEVEGAPARVEVALELPEGVRQHLSGEVTFVPFAVDGRGERSQSRGAVELRPDRQVREVRFVPVEKGLPVQVLAGERPGEHLVGLGVAVELEGKGRSRLVGSAVARVEVVFEDGQVAPADNYRVIGGLVQARRGEGGEMQVQVQGGWDPERRRRTRWPEIYTQPGAVPRPSLGIYTGPDGRQWRAVFFPLVVGGAGAGKFAALEGEGLEGLQRVMREEARVLAEEAGALAAPLPHSGESYVLSFVPGRTQLLGNHPNPFNPSTQIGFASAQAGRVELTVYDLLGQEVRVLVEGDWPAGVHQVEWDGRDEAGRPVASGVYLCRLQAGAQVETRKLMLRR